MRVLFFQLMAAALLLTACHKEKDDPKQPDRQSVLVYIAGDNNLQSFVMSDVKQMMEGSKQLASDCNLVLFVDQRGKLPYFLKVEKGDTVRIETLKESVKTSDAETLSMAMKWMTEHYSAKNYGLVLWGHADGWLVWKPSKSRPRQAYGQDTTGGESWMNISEMAQALATPTLPHLRFIFADCCCFQSVESAYELRNVADYIIGSAAEIPGEGAPYQTIIPLLFNQQENFYQLVAEAYNAQLSEGYPEPMAVVKTSEMDNLAQATRTALKQCAVNLQTDGYPNLDELIYYFDQSLFDMNDFMLRFASDNVYTEWRRTFEKAVPCRLMTTVWMANHVPYLDFDSTTFRDFEITEKRYGGISMYVPQDKSSTFYQQQNDRIKEMQWYQAAGLAELGW